MRVLHLRGENFMRVRAVEITPTGDVVKISGRNGEGKTSTIDLIWAALDLASLNLGQPIRQGAKKAVIKMDMGEVQVERVITPKGHELKVTGPEGRVASPQKFLDSLVGQLSFDPLAFERMKPQEQYEELRKAVKIDTDFAAIAKANERAFDRRTELNRQAKLKRAQADGMKLPGLRSGLVPVDEAPIAAKIKQAGEHNAAIDARKAKRAAVLQHAEANEAQAARTAKRISEVKVELAALEAEQAQCEAEAKGARERLAAAAPLPEKLDVTRLTDELVDAQRQNAGIEQAKRHAALEQEAAQLEAEAAALTADIEQRNRSKEEALASAKMPVAGLSLGDGEVLLDGLPFNQASAAARLRVGMAIAMAANPKIRVIRIGDGSLLDSKSMAIVGEMAKSNDFQVWAEIVDESGKVGIVIEDGAVAAVNP